MKIEIRDDLINDHIYKCCSCESVMMVFNSEGSTQFCSNCGCRELEDEVTQSSGKEAKKC